MAQLNKATSMPPLAKQRSWSPDSDREEAWLRRKGIQRNRRRMTRLSRSVTDEDLDELRGCIDLGFGFGCESSTTGDNIKLSNTFPALDLYYAVHRQYADSMTGSSASESSTAGSPVDSPVSIYSPGESPQAVKAKLKQWAQVVACSVRERC